AAIELTVGVFAIIYGGRWSALGVTGLFAGFTVVSVVLRHRSGDVSCGCFGGLSARVRPLHVVANAVLGMVSLAAVVWPVPGLVADHGRLPGHGVPDAALVVAGAIIAVAIFGPYSALRDARSPNRPVRIQP
ncbi:MAG TPA: MauE/DoxX family redox-associated membrane protein, partial [Acidimicrobiales bacterium]|nr:MauE/DoxX family redox-associated membrane protein [Acidimicrobiales bacterium]